MAFDEGLAERVRQILGDQSTLVEKRMFGGLAFMVRGHMCVGILKRDLMVRVGPESHAKAVRMRGARAMDFTGRPMKGLVFVAGPAIDRDADLERWVSYGVTYVRSLPPKLISSRAPRGRVRGRL